MPHKDEQERRAWRRGWRVRNLNRVKVKHRQYRKEGTAKNKRFIAQYLTTHPCVVCGETDPVVLEFDHRDRSKKKFNIGGHHGRAYSTQTLLKEMLKCDVLCANCHRRRTHRQIQEAGLNWGGKARINDAPHPDLFHD